MFPMLAYALSSLNVTNQLNLYVNETGLLLRMGKLNDLSGP